MRRLMLRGVLSSCLCGAAARHCRAGWHDWQERAVGSQELRVSSSSRVERVEGGGNHSAQSLPAGGVNRSGPVSGHRQRRWSGTWARHCIVIVIVVVVIVIFVIIVVVIVIFVIVVFLVLRPCHCWCRVACVSVFVRVVG